MLSLIKEYDLPYVFPKAVVNEAKSKGNKINEKDIKNRKDLRNDIVFTIDGQDAKDLDDAVSVKSTNKRDKYIYARKSYTNASKRTF